MKIKYLPLLALLGFVLFNPARAAEPIGSVDAFINGVVYMSSKKCSENKGSLGQEFKNRGDALGAYQVAMAEKMICDCIPARLKSLQGRLSKAERSARMSESVFASKYFSEVQSHCVGEQMKSTFSGACDERFAKRVPDSAKFCSCMKAYTSELSGAQAVQLGGDTADYTELAVASRKNGTAPPTPSPLLQSMMDAQKGCALP